MNRIPYSFPRSAYSTCRVGRSGPNLQPKTVCVCGIGGLRKGMHTTQHPPSSASRAWTDPPTNVQAVSRAVRYANTHRPRFQIRARPSYTSSSYLIGAAPSSSNTCSWRRASSTFDARTRLRLSLPVRACGHSLAFTR